MKKLFALLAVAGVLSFGNSQYVYSLDDNDTVEAVDTTQAEETPVVESPVTKKAEVTSAADATKKTAQLTTTQTIKIKFIEGGPGFMGIVLLALIIGLALCIERIVYLNMATTNTKKLLAAIEGALNSGGVEGVEAAKEVCRNIRGPVASIFYQGLDRYNPSEAGTIENVEKSIESYGGVQMGLLEKGLSWISLFIALAPMLGFMGTVIGMIGAFDEIQRQKNIAPDVVAEGIKVALLTTVFGLVAAIILQVFYNYILSKIDGIVNQMEDASLSFVDILIKNK